MADETLRLQFAALIDRGGKLTVEMIYAVKPEQDYAQSIGLTLRLPIEHEYPLLPEAELEALRRVRNLVGSEIQRIEKMRGPSR
jgi:hypothetical protein